MAKTHFKTPLPLCSPSWCHCVQNMSDAIIWQDVWKATELKLSEPQLPRAQRAPKRFEVGTGQPSFPLSLKEYYRRHYWYFGVVDLSVKALMQLNVVLINKASRHIYQRMEELLLKSLWEEDTSDELRYFTDNYSDDLNTLSLKVQLLLFNGLLHSDSAFCYFERFNDICLAMKELNTAQRCLITEVIILVKLLLVNPSTKCSTREELLDC